MNLSPTLPLELQDMRNCLAEHLFLSTQLLLIPPRLALEFNV